MFLLILLSICAISHVSAEEISDNSTGNLIASDNIDEVVGETHEDVIANETTTVEANTSSDTPAPQKSAATIKASKATVAYKKIQNGQ